ncbi:MAG: hypothetical protein CVU50_02025 [Candidatus Cloacimonetes bacterium HGW-Cloacimonetes-3]|jgi:hypothetical protein|nr:MAG: hypothetical protein CVU50_02025 [Candidatus Cloacimonetes bacterium HGW-Cloacimonetes-3]
MKKILLITLILMSTIALRALPDIRIEAETGIAVSGYNDVRIPNSGNNTMFSLKNDLGLQSALSTRLSVHYRITPRHQISLMAAPLTLKAEEKLTKDVVYQGKHFWRNDLVKTEYRFDSYRLQYRYYLPREFVGIRTVGASIKMRDAEILLESSSNKSSKTNTGFVPLLSINAGYRINNELDLVLEAEGLASPYGRAEDVFVGAFYDVHKRLKIKAGYRILEGGADNEEVLTFAAVHYALLGFQVRL